MKWFKANLYHENTQNHVEKPVCIFHIRGWPGYFGSGHAGLDRTGDKTIFVSKPFKNIQVQGDKKILMHEHILRIKI